MKIYISSDHAGFELKEKLKPFISDLGYEVEDMGTHTYVQTDDYPDSSVPVAEAVARDWANLDLADFHSTNLANRGIVLCGSSVGETIVANRVKGIRAFGYYGGTIDILKLSREHNDANILALGARLINEEEAMYAVKIWLKTDFPGEERHLRRIQKIDK